MKILFYSSYFYPYISGLTIYPLRVLQRLEKKNRITVLTFRHRKEVPTEEVFKGIKIKRLNYLFRISKGFISPQSLPVFLKEILRNDIIILNIPNFEALPLAILGKILGKKIISIFCCEVFLDNTFFSKIIVFFLNSSIFIQLLLSDKIVGFPEYIEKLFIYKLFKDKTIKTLPLIERKEINSVTLNRYKKEKGKNVWVGYVGRIAREKGIEYLIEATAKINFKRPIKLMLAGPLGDEVVGENRYFSKIREKIRKKKIAFEFLGKLNDKDLGAFYKAIDVLVLPSINKTEAFGMVQAEAMVLGTPVVSSDLPGVRTAVRLTKMGKIFTYNNPESLSEALLEVLNKKKVYTKKSLVEEASRIFSDKRVVNFYEKLLSDLSSA